MKYLKNNNFFRQDFDERIALLSNGEIGLTEFAALHDIDENLATQIANGEVMNKSVAMLLAKFFHTSTEYWKNMYVNCKMIKQLCKE